MLSLSYMSNNIPCPLTPLPQICCYFFYCQLVIVFRFGKHQKLDDKVSALVNCKWPNLPTNNLVIVEETMQGGFVAMIIHTALANHAAYGACNNFEEAVGKVFTIFSSNLCCPLFPLFLHPPYGICSLPQFTTNRAQTGSHNDSKGLWRLRFASTSRRLDVMG